MTQSNVSPSEPKKPRSPWMWVGLGCGVTVLLTFGGCMAFLGFVGNRAAQEISKPLDQKEVLDKLGNIPIYQPSTFNEMMTKGVRIGSSLFPGDRFSAAAFDTSDEPKQVIDWYQQQLQAVGYKKIQSSSDNQITQASFQKGSESIVVQVQETTAATSSQKNMFLLMRMKAPAAKASP
jgi:hypothetical protein